MSLHDPLGVHPRESKLLPETAHPFPAIQGWSSEQLVTNPLHLRGQIHRTVSNATLAAKWPQRSAPLIANTSSNSPIAPCFPSILHYRAIPPLKWQISYFSLSFICWGMMTLEFSWAASGAQQPCTAPNKRGCLAACTSCVMKWQIVPSFSSQDANCGGMEH